MHALIDPTNIPAFKPRPLRFSRRLVLLSFGVSVSVHAGLSVLLASQDVPPSPPHAGRAGAMPDGERKPVAVTLVMRMSDFAEPGRSMPSERVAPPSDTPPSEAATQANTTKPPAQTPPKEADAVAQQTPRQSEPTPNEPSSKEESAPKAEDEQLALSGQDATAPPPTPTPTPTPRDDTQDTPSDAEPQDQPNVEPVALAEVSEPTPEMKLTPEAIAALAELAEAQAQSLIDRVLPELESLVTSGTPAQDADDPPTTQASTQASTNTPPTTESPQPPAQSQPQAQPEHPQHTPAKDAEPTPAEPATPSQAGKQDPTDADREDAPAPPATVYDQESVDRPIGFKSMARPKVSSVSKRLGDSGVIRILVEVDAEGGLIRHKVLDDAGQPRLLEAALGAMEESTFTAAERGGEPVRSTRVIEYRF